MSHILLIFIAEVPGWNSKYSQTVRHILLKEEEEKKMNKSSELNLNAGTFLRCSGTKSLHRSRENEM